jgi:hypothetical protein
MKHKRNLGMCCNLFRLELNVYRVRDFETVNLNQNEMVKLKYLIIESMYKVLKHSKYQF